MKHLGDITKIDGGKIEPVDVITAGSPCQDLSVAGKREGLAGERSGLFMEFIRIVREMREATNGKYPAFVVWENVPGAFSSNGGEDFHAVLQELAGLAAPGADVPRPPGGAWHTAGVVVGDGWSLAWRVFDSQFWGVPQRRRRIAVVLDFGTESAPKILFEREGVPGYPTPGGAERQGTAADAETGAVGAIPILEPGKRTGKSTDDARCGSGIGEAGDPMYTLQSGAQHGVAAFMAGQGAKAGGIAYGEEVSPTLKASASGLNQSPCVCEPEIASTLTTRSHDSSPMPAQLQGIVTVMPFDTNQITSKTNRSQPQYGSPCHTLAAFGDAPSVVCMSTGQANAEINTELAPTLNCDHEQPIACAGYHVRRLTPLECERLQGFPDGWTNIPPALELVDGKWKEIRCSDAARYRALGNSIALPPWVYVLGEIQRALGRSGTLGSLFDGIGGFPLVWERLNGPNTARWASEIELFPMAVTKYHFGGD